MQTTPLLQLSLPHSPEITHAFFTRQLLSPHQYRVESGASPENVLISRRAAMEKLGYEEKQLSLTKQVHGNNVLFINQFSPMTPLREADGQVTNIPGIALGVLTADCVPILFYETEAKVIGSAHAGWRGAIGGIIESTLISMEQLGAKRQNITAMIGACIHQASYEVGPEFYEYFCLKASENSHYFIPSPLPNHYLFDLPGFVKHTLHAAGISTIFSLEKDTFAEEELFFSYRRCTKRQEKYRHNLLSVICLNTSSS